MPRVESLSITEYDGLSGENSVDQISKMFPQNHPQNKEANESGIFSELDQHSVKLKEPSEETIVTHEQEKTEPDEGPKAVYMKIKDDDFKVDKVYNGRNDNSTNTIETMA